MVLIALSCPHCHQAETVTKYGFTKQGKQRYCCHNEQCPVQTFITDYTHKGCQPEVEEKV